MRLTRFLSATALMTTIATPALAQAQAPAAAPSTSLRLLPVALQTSQTNQATQNTTPTDQSQTTAEPAANPTGTQDQQQAAGDVVVTGSRIARPTLESPVPVTTVTAQDLLSTGTINVGDALNNLPALRSTFSQANSERFIGTSGLNVLDLRGLGTARTLVLVNGRRHITASPGDLLVDTNTIPDELLERVDVVTGGSSAVYGSDAVAGVVNFILKRNFDGIRATGQGSITSRGDRGSYFGSLTAGKNFADDRGNIALAVEYSRAEALYNTQRDDLTGAFSGRSQFNLAENTTGEPAGGNGVPDNQFFTNVRNGSISDGGLVTASCTTATLADRTRCRASGVGQRYVFNDQGVLVISNPSLDFRDITGGLSTNTVGGLGSTLRNTGQLDPGLERYSANLLAHFDISDAFRPFLEAKYVRIYANQEGQPSFFSPISSTLGLPNLRCNNGFLSAQNLATLQAIGLCAVPATGTISLARFNVDFGGRGELHRRETYRAVGGVEGTFNGDWHYDVAVNYGRLDTRLKSLNNLLLFDINGNLDGFGLAYNAVLAPATFTGTNFALNSAGQKVICSVNATTNARPDCVPINLFGTNQADPRALAFSNTTAMRRERATETDVTANVSGDTSGFFNLPGGPVRFAVGGEYRRETAHSAFDALTASGATFLNAIQPFNPPAISVKEGYGELEVPLLKDVPFFQELTLSGAARVSDYNTSTGTVYSYNGNVYWAPIHSLRFRGGYARSVRAPTQSDLFATASQNFAFVADPCDIANINNGTGSRAANCAALGVPAGFINTSARQQSQSYLSGGNPSLQAERSDSYTAGLIFEPSFLPGFSITADYYDIKVKNLISGVSIQTILNQCVDSPNINNSYCALLRPRNADGTFGTSIGLASTLNFAKQTTSGVDVDLAYNRRFGGDRLAIRGILSITADKTNYLDPVNPTIPSRQLGNLGDPQFEFQVSAQYELAGGFSFRYQLQYIGKQSIGDYCAQRSCFGNPPQNFDQFARVDYPVVTYSNIRLAQKVNQKFEFYFGIDNLFDKYPPLGLQGTTSGGGIYSNVGRQFYSGFRANF